MTAKNRLPIVSDAADPRPPTVSDTGSIGTGSIGTGSIGTRSDDLLQVGELAKRCGKTVRAIHHYENLGLLSPHKRSKGRYRLYAPDAIARVQWISKLHDMGMTLSQVQEIVASWEKAPSAPEAMATLRGIYSQKLEEVREQVRRLAALEHELSASLHYLDTCEACEPHELTDACSCCTVHREEEVEPPLVSGLYAN
jgi:MerR family transcriptional regulator, copper efflux regulator